MQPLELKAYIKPDNKLIDIYGYELRRDRIMFDDGYYYRTLPKDDVKILRCSGVSDVNGNFAFEDDIVQYEGVEPARYTINFHNGAFHADDHQLTGIFTIVGNANIV